MLCGNDNNQVNDNDLKSFEELMLFYKNSAWKYDLVSLIVFSFNYHHFQTKNRDFQF